MNTTTIYPVLHPCGETASERGWLAQVHEWLDLARSRRQLRNLDDRQLADIGLRRSDALAEARKPFWQE